MSVLEYIIDSKKYEVEVGENQIFECGEDVVYSNRDNDICFDQSWYHKGYDIVGLQNKKSFNHLKAGLTGCVKEIVNKELGLNATDFDLEKYHDYIRSDEDHYRVVSRTRDLYSKDFNFPIFEVTKKFEKTLGFKLTDVNPRNNKKLHVIIRINRPGSSDYNPPHKDIYEGVDEVSSYIPQFVNFWIPICGVDENSSLPIAVSSHRISESKIFRTRVGSIVGNNRYRVRMVKEWNRDNSLVRAQVAEGQALVFTSHLVHGLATNDNENKTRISLEFRLFKSSD